MTDNNLFFQDLVKTMKDEDMHLANEGASSGEFTGFIDTGAYALNALLSGSIYGGIPNNKRTMFAGESSVGKTFFALSIVKQLLDADERSGVLYYDSESAITKQMLVERNIDVSRVIIIDVDTVQSLRTKILKFVKAYLEQPEKSRPQMAIVVDSIGNLSTTKEMVDIEAGKDVRDMTRAQLLRGFGRSVTVPLARAGVPLIMTNHTYATMGLFPAQELSGGGIKYTADSIVFLSKAQDKTSTGEHRGIFITARNFKSRLTREKGVVKLNLSFTHGLDRYYGLLEIAERGGLVTKMSTKYTLPDGQSAKESVIYNNPTKYFTPEFLDMIDKVAGDLFKYGGNADDSLVENVVESDEDE